MTEKKVIISTKKGFIILDAVGYYKNNRLTVCTLSDCKHRETL